LTEAEDQRENPPNSVPLALGRFNQLSIKVATAHGLVEARF
jgi:hypothetical protein